MIDDPMNSKLFELYVATQLVPTLPTGDEIILDNLAFQQAPRAASYEAD